MLALHLSANNLGEKAARAMLLCMAGLNEAAAQLSATRGLAVPTGGCSLHALDLSDNGLVLAPTSIDDGSGSGSGSPLAAFVAAGGGGALRELNLEGNNLCEAVGVGLVEAILDNTVLCFLRLGGADGRKGIVS